MEKPLPNFPLLFEKIGYFLVQFNKLAELRQSAAHEFTKGIDELMKSSSPSPGEEALAAFEEILDTVYADRAARSCPTGSPKMRG